MKIPCNINVTNQEYHFSYTFKFDELNCGRPSLNAVVYRLGKIMGVFGEFEGKITRFREEMVRNSLLTFCLD